MTKIIPFWVWPGSWGLSGTTREIARTEYIYSNDPEKAARLTAGLRYNPKSDEYKLEILWIDEKYGHKTEYEAEYERISIKHTGTDRDILLLDLDLKYEKITSHVHAVKKANLTLTGLELEAALIQISYDHGEITDYEAEKQIATLNQEPWVKVIGEQSEPGIPDTLGLEVVYNSYFIEYLVEQGYVGNEDQIINEWFIELSKQIAAEDAPPIVGTKSTPSDDGETRRYE